MSSNENLTLQKIYEEILKNRNELKSIVEASEVRILLTLETINNRVTTLEKEKQQLKRRVEILERQHKRNSVVIFGINKPFREISPEYICNELNGMLETNLVQADLNDIYPLGTSENRPIKVEFLSNLKKQSVIKNCHKLKGKKVSIANDLTLAQREELKVLKKHLNKARENQENKSYIKGNKLYINDIAYNAQDLEELEEIEGTRRNKSAPPTPSINQTHSCNLAEEVFEFSVVQSQQSPKVLPQVQESSNSTAPRKNSNNTPKSTGVKGGKNINAKEKPTTRSTSSQKKY